MTKIAVTLLRALKHPTLYTRKAVGKMKRNLIRVPSAQVVELSRGVRFEHRQLPFLDEDDYRAMLTGTYDIPLCDFMRRRLSQGDIVLDVGANVGYISAIALSCVGQTGEVHSFEPLSECFDRLLAVARLNPCFTLACNHFALGESEGSLPISFDPRGDSRNATLVPGYERPLNYEVPVRRLDAYIRERIVDAERIKLVKIDVEGFEFPVLRGMERFLAESSCRPPIVVEIKPWDLARIGHSMREFSEYVSGFGYRAYDMLDQRREVNLVAMKSMDVVMLRAEASQPRNL